MEIADAVFRVLLRRHVTPYPLRPRTATALGGVAHNAVVEGAYVDGSGQPFVPDPDAAYWDEKARRADSRGVPVSPCDPRAAAQARRPR